MFAQALQIHFRNTIVFGICHRSEMAKFGFAVVFFVFASIRR